MNVTQHADSKTTTIRQRADDLLSKMTLREKVALLAGKDNWQTVAIERLGIPSVVMTDGPHGVRTNRADAGRIIGPATSFPTGVSIAASWDVDLIERVGAALADETRAMGCDILLGPCVNIVRTPLAGRNFESYSEDPYLAGRIGVAYVKGVQSRGVGTSLKHYACNNQEFERFRGSSVVDERTLREIYLAQFETIVKEAQPWTVMCSYNRINGVYASENHYLLTEILRDEWGFEGVVVSDWGANHTTVESVKGGLDIEMPGPARYYGGLLIDEALIDQSARRILSLIMQCGKLDDPARLPPGAVNTPEHQALARELAEESITLLKNDGNLLPLNPDRIKLMAVIGPNAAEARIGGGGSSFLEPPYRVSPLDALKTKVGSQIEISYEQGCDNYVELPVLKSDYLTPARGDGHGLWGEYFSSPDFSGKPHLERVDPQLDFWWFIHPEGEHGSSGQSSIRWTGKLAAPDTGRYTFKLSSSGQGRLVVDGNVLIDHPGGLAARHQAELAAPVQMELEAGRAYDILVEFVRPTDEEFAALRLMFAYTPNPDEDDRMARAVSLAKESDVAVIFAGMPEGYETEGRDRPDMELPGAQAELIEAVVKANPNTVVVLNCGSPVTMPWLEDVPAVVEAFYPGLEGGSATANVLLGQVNPSGKLPVTFPKRLQDTPAFGNYPGTKEVHYGEGIFVGYRHYDQREVEPLFPFGHGLSYTTFEYGRITAPARAKIGEPVRLAVTVKNTGNTAGKEVVQVYVHDAQSSLIRPPKELKAFAKIALQPGESQNVSFVLDQRAFALYDPYRKAWIVEPGQFEILVGSSSRDIRAIATINLEG
jgi:beta-glucosidase